MILKALRPFLPDPAGTNSTKTLAAILLAVSTVGTGAETPPLEVRCGVVYSVHARNSFGQWPSTINSSMGAGWPYMLLMSYAPFVSVTNHVGIPITLGGSTGQPALVEFDQPELGLRFKRVGPTRAGFVTFQSVPLDQMYVLANSSTVKKFTMKLFGGADGGSPAGAAIVNPGQTLVFGPWLAGAGFEEVLDWKNDKTSSIPCVPGWSGPSFGYCIDWLAGASGTIDSSVNSNLRIIPTRAADEWDVEVNPTGALNGCRVFRPTTQPAASWPWDPDASLEITAFPSNLTDFQPALAAGSMFVSASATVESWSVKPILSVVLPAASTQLLLKDTNRNGMDDGWEALHFPSQTVDPIGDLDGDGHSNFSEFLAGSSPVDAGDFIRTSLKRGEDGSWRLEWSSVNQRSYVVESSEDLNEWTSVSTVTAAAPTCSYPVGEGTGSARYFRLRILPPP